MCEILIFPHFPDMCLLGGLQQLNQNVQDLSVPKSVGNACDRKLSISSNLSDKNQNGDSGILDSPVDRKESGGKTPDSVSTTDSMRQHGSSSAFSLVRPKLEPGKYLMLPLSQSLKNNNFFPEFPFIFKPFFHQSFFVHLSVLLRNLGI